MSNKLDVFLEMPSLKHWVGKEEGYEFELERSEVLGWVAAQLGVLDWVMGKASERGLIIYDKETNLWSGAGVKLVGSVGPEVEQQRARHERGGRPRKVTEELKVEIIKRMGDREWGKNRFAKANLDLGSRATIFRGIRQLIEEGRVVTLGRNEIQKVARVRVNQASFPLT